MRRMLSISVLLTFLTVTSVGAIELPKSRLQEEIGYTQISLRYSADQQDDFQYKKDRSDTGGGSGKKSLAKAAILSALVPGAGEYYIGQKTKARYFFAAEIITWVSYASFKTYANWKEDDFIRLAEARAGVDMSDKDKEFQDWVGFYDDIDEFNTFGRIFEPDRSYLEVTPENSWRWTDTNDRLIYRELKNRSREADRRADFMIGVAVVNRIVSVIDAIVSTKRMLRSIDTDLFGGSQLKIDVNPSSDIRQFQLTLITDL